MSFRIVRTIYLKELVDTLRDKRTLVAMIGIPVVLYPALLIAASQVAMVQQSKIQETVSRIAVEPSDSELAADWLADAPLLKIMDAENPTDELAKGRLDAVVRIPAEAESAIAADETARIGIAYDATEGPSREAMTRVREALEKREAELLNRRLSERELPETFAKPLEIEPENVAPPEKTTGTLLGTVLPLVMVVMLGVGAFYPAVDLTAGEKERGTFETLLSTPASKLEIVSGKFCAVFTLSMFTGMLNLGSMTATIAFQFSQFMNQLAGDADVPQIDFTTVAPVTIGAMIVVLIPLAFFISAVMMTVALMARTFKDAQNLVTPFFMLIVMPAMIGVIPDVELSATTQFIPIGNVALLFRDLLKGTATPDAVFVVFLCTATYALLGLVFASWMFQREEVILSEEKGIPLTLRRGDIRPSDAPTPGLALSLFGVVMLLIFYVGSYVQARDIHVGLAVTQYGLILTPTVGLLWFARVDLVKALNLRAPRLGAVLGTVPLIAGWIVLSMQVSVWQSRVLPLPEGFEVIEQLLFGVDEPVSLWILLGVIAVSPAICEELLFRGALLSAFRDRIPPWAVVAAVAVLFGLFHLSIHRFVPTALSGAVLTYLAVRTGSIAPAMLAHLLLNGTMVVLASGHMPGAAEKFFQDALETGQGFGLGALGIAVLAVAVGAFAIEKTRAASSS